MWRWLAHRRRAVRAHVDEGPTFLRPSPLNSPQLLARRHTFLGPGRLLSRSGLPPHPSSSLEGRGRGLQTWPGQRGRLGREER